MAIYLNDHPARQDRSLEEFETPFRSYLRAKFDEAWDSNFTPMAAQTLGMHTYEAPRRLSMEDAKATAESEGIKTLHIPEDGIAEPALKILIDRHKRKAANDDAINRSPFGLRSIAGFGASLAAGLLDPVNVALAFVPVVGQARYGLALAAASGALGRAGVRAAVGGIQGAAGMAAIEPFQYAMHQGLQDDYKMLDSLMNIGFGGVLGGTIHVGAGVFGDVVTGRYARRPSVPPDNPPNPPPAAAPTPPNAEAAQNPTVIQDLASSNRSVPEALNLYRGEGEGKTPGFRQAGAVWTTPDQSLAKAYADAEVNGRVIEYKNVRLLKPFVFDGENAPELTKYFTGGADDPALVKFFQEHGLAAISPEAKAALLADGYDSIIVKKESFIDPDSVSGPSVVLLNDPATYIRPSAAQPPASVDAAEVGRSPQDTRLLLDRLSQDTNDALMRTAIAQSLEGKYPDLAAIVQMDPKSGLANADQMPAVPEGMVRYYHGGNPKDVTGSLWFTSDLKDAKGWASRGDGMDVWYVDVPEGHPARGGDPVFGVLPPSRMEFPVEIASQRRLLGSPLEHLSQMDPILSNADPMAAVRATADRQSRPEATRVADPRAAAEADRQIAEAPKTHDLKAAEAETAIAEAQLNERARLAGVSPETIKAEMALHDEARAMADEYANAANAAVICGIR